MNTNLRGKPSLWLPLGWLSTAFNMPFSTRRCGKVRSETDGAADGFGDIRDVQKDSLFEALGKSNRCVL